VAVDSADSGGFPPAQGPDLLEAVTTFEAIRRRNRRELAAAAVLVACCVVLALVLPQPAKLAALAMAGAACVIGGVLVRHGLPTNLDTAVDRNSLASEVDRQARLSSTALMWYILPLFVSCTALALALDPQVRQGGAPREITFGVVLVITLVHGGVWMMNRRAASTLRQLATRLVA
jgi:hypothetical protein